MRKGISIVIPVYGSEQTIAPLCEEISQVFQNKLPETDYEIILVNDCSPDQVASVLDRLSKASSRIRVFTFMRNFGQHNATLFGIRQARFSVTVTMDDDGQHNPADIPALLNALHERKERIIYACPLEENRGFFRSFASKYIKKILNAAFGGKGADSIASFRCFDTRLRNMFAEYHDSDVFVDALLSWGSASYAISVPLRKRTEGKSGYTFKKLIAHTLNLITAFTVVPLRIASLIGIFLTFLGVVALFIVGIRFFILGREVPGFILLFSTVVTFSGIQLLTLGIFGEYIGRIYLRQMHRPQYILESSNEMENDHE